MTLRRFMAAGYAGTEVELMGSVVARMRVQRVVASTLELRTQSHAYDVAEPAAEIAHETDRHQATGIEHSRRKQ